MKNEKEGIIKYFNKWFNKPKSDSKKRRLEQNPATGEINWGKGEKPFEDGPESEDGKPIPFELDDNKKTGTRMFRPVPIEQEPYRKNRFQIDFPGIPSYFFNSYHYDGTDTSTMHKLLSSKKVIRDDYSVFKVLLLFPNEIDICEKLKELEKSPKVGDVKIHLLDPVGSIVKTIVIPGCEVTEIKAFRELEYGKAGDKEDSILFGEIVVKHKQRKLI